MKITQEETILNLLKSKGPEGVYPTELTEGLHITQPLGRVHGLRKRFGCTHKSGKKACSAQEHIENRRIPNGHTKYFYWKDHIDRNQEMREYIERKKVKSPQMTLV